MRTVEKCYRLTVCSPDEAKQWDKKSTATAGSRGMVGADLRVCPDTERTQKKSGKTRIGISAFKNSSCAAIQIAIFASRSNAP